MSKLLVYQCGQGNPLRITGVDAGSFSPEEIRRRSVAKITEPIIYEKNVPKLGGVNDHRLGVVDRKFRCGTCGGMVGQCQGHEGHIDLPWPVYHVGQLDKILKVLRLVCFSCSRLVFDPVQPKYRTIIETTMHKNRLNALAHAAKTARKCRFDDTHCCAYKQPVYGRSGLIITCDWKELEPTMSPQDFDQLKQHAFTAREALEILQNISDDDCRILGFDPVASRPEWMIQTVVLVSSPVIRPAITETSGARTKGQDDLTKKMVDIVKAVRNIEKWKLTKSQTSATQYLLGDCDPPPVALLEELQLHTGTLINNEIRGAKPSVQRSGQPTKSIATRLKGKEGRVRGNLMGKRVDHSGRNVISPDACIDANQIGVSETTRHKGIYPERVNVYNYDLCTTMVRRGANDLLGAYAIATHDKSVVYLQALDRNQREMIRLEIGWTVYRYIRDGDWVILNRQPSLHRGSMLAFQCKSLPGTTTRLNLANTPTFNADFDGDEMNMHFVMSEMTRAEAQEILSNERNMITPQSHRPIIALVQDSLVGAHLFTRKNVFLERHQVMQLMMAMHHEVNGKNNRRLPEPAILKPKPLWTGKQVFSMLFPRRLNVKRRVRNPKDPKDYFDPHESIVVVREGELLSGSLCKQTVGATQGSIVGLIFRDVSPKDAMNFVSDAQRVIHAWMLERGLSFGPDDVICPAASDARIDDALEKFVTHVDTQLQPLKKSTLSGFNKQDVEQTLMRLGNNAVGVAGSIVTSSVNVDTNSFYATSVSGSKGSTLNMTQVSGCLGQQVHEGKRIEVDVYSDRTLPSYAHGERSVKSLGFVCSNFERGLRPQEMFFHAMSGRESLSDTAVKTADIGYLQRRLMKSMESLTVQHDRTVRNADNCVVEFAYGGDGIDAIKGELIKLKELTMDHAQLRTHFITSWMTIPSNHRIYNNNNDDSRGGDDNAAPLLLSVLEEELNHITQLRDRIIQAKLSGSMGGKYDMTLYVSVNAARLVQRFRPQRSNNSSKHFRKNDPSEVAGVATCRQILDAVNRLCERIRRVCRVDAIANVSIQFVIRCVLSCRNMLGKYAYDIDSLHELCDFIYMEYVKSFADAGDGVGAIAAESIGEPTTQMTLNTFHFAGVMEKNVTLGVPRLKELIDATTKMKKPSITVYLKEPFSRSTQGAAMVRDAVEYLTLDHVVKTSTIVHRDDPIIDNDEKFAITVGRLFMGSGSSKTITTATTAPSCESQPHERPAYVIRYTLNKSLLILRGLAPSDVHAAVAKILGGPSKATIISSEYNMQEWFIRIELLDIPAMASRVVVATSSLSVSATAPANRDDVEKSMVLRVMNDLLESCVLGGLANIRKAVVSPVTTQFLHPNIPGRIEKKTEHVLYTEGTCLSQVLSIPTVDATRTISNDIHEVNAVLGIDAASDVLFHEIKQVLAFDGTYVQDRHILLSVHTMSWWGYFVPMNRHGMDRMEKGFLMQASFEETYDIINDADAFGIHDDMRGVTSNIIMGQTAPMGTCIFSVMGTKNDIPNAAAGVPAAVPSSNPSAFKAPLFSYSPQPSLVRGRGNPNNNTNHLSNVRPGTTSPSSTQLSGGTLRTATTTTSTAVRGRIVQTKAVANTSLSQKTTERMTNFSAEHNKPLAVSSSPTVTVDTGVSQQQISQVLQTTPTLEALLSDMSWVMDSVVLTATMSAPLTEPDMCLSPSSCTTVPKNNASNEYNAIVGTKGDTRLHMEIMTGNRLPSSSISTTTSSKESEGQQNSSSRRLIDQSKHSGGGSSLSSSSSSIYTSPPATHSPESTATNCTDVSQLNQTPRMVSSWRTGYRPSSPAVRRKRHVARAATDTTEPFRRMSNDQLDCMITNLFQACKKD